MFASELMEMVRKEPEKYEKKIFEITGGYAISSTGKTVPIITINCGTAREGHTGNIVYFSTDTQIKEIRIPISLNDAIKAYSNGQKVKCIFPDFNNPVHTCSRIFKKTHTGMCDEEITLYMLETGTWYIED